MIATCERRPFPIGWVLLIFFIGLAMGYIQLNRHAVETHGSDAVAVDQCFDQHGVEFEMSNPDLFRKVQVCRDPKKPTTFYILIISTFSGMCVTAFIFKKGQRSDRQRVQNYYRDKGFK